MHTATRPIATIARHPGTRRVDAGLFLGLVANPNITVSATNGYASANANDSVVAFWIDQSFDSYNGSATAHGGVVTTYGAEATFVANGGVAIATGPPVRVTLQIAIG